MIASVLSGVVSLNIICTTRWDPMLTLLKTHLSVNPWFVHRSTEMIVADA